MSRVPHPSPLLGRVGFHKASRHFAVAFAFLSVIPRRICLFVPAPEREDCTPLLNTLCASIMRGLYWSHPGIGRCIPVDYSQIITIEPGKRSGKPCVRGTRMTVYDVLGYMAAGMSQQEILADFPSLTETDIRACLAFAADGEHAFEIIST